MWICNHLWRIRRFPAVFSGMSSDDQNIWHPLSNPNGIGLFSPGSRGTSHAGPMQHRIPQPCKGCSGPQEIRFNHGFCRFSAVRMVLSNPFRVAESVCALTQRSPEGFRGNAGLNDSNPFRIEEPSHRNHREPRLFPSIFQLPPRKVAQAGRPSCSLRLGGFAPLR